MGDTWCKGFFIICDYNLLFYRIYSDNFRGKSTTYFQFLSSHLNIAFTDYNDETLKKYKEVLGGIKSGIEKINNNKSGEYEKDYMKIKFDLDDKLPLNKQLKLLSVTIVIRSVFEDDGKYYPQAFLDDCLYEL